MLLKKSKIILLYSIIILSITFFIKFNRNITNKYSIKEKEVKGTITECIAEKKITKIIIENKEKILINYNQKYKCELGTKIKATGSIQRQKNNTVFNQFNYKNYLLSKNIKLIFQANKITKIKPNTNILYKIKNKLYNHINKYKSKDYLKAFIIGDQTNIDENIKKSYRENGISHLLAISGTQIAILMTIITFFLKKHHTVKIFFLIIYITLTTLSPSIIRAAITYVVLYITNIFNIKIKSEYVLLLIMVIMLNINPYYIYSLSFQLSFIVSLYLIHYKKIIYKTKKYIKKIFILSCISFMSSLPILINANHEINFIAPINNIYFVPLITLIIYPLSLLTLLIKPLDDILYKLVIIIEKISKKAQKIKFLTFPFSHISIIEIIIYYIILTITLYKIQKGNKKYILLYLLMIIILYNINYFNPENKITYIDIGQGDSILMQLKNNKGNILIDTGGSYTYSNITENTIIPYFKSEGIKKIDYIIISHGDYDHMGEAINLVNNFKVEKVIFNCGPYNDLEKKLIKVLDKKKIPYYSCIKELNIDNNKLYFLQTKEYDNENDNSNVIYTELDGYKFMFMGDASVTTEKEIMNKYNLQDVDILKVGHHGSKTSSSKEFINEVNPKYSIISVGKNNRYGHPNKEVLDTLDKSKIYRTDQDGSIMFKIKNNKVKIETCSP